MIPDIHIAFGDSAAGNLKAALRDIGIDGYRDKVIAFSDLFSIGPVWRLHQESGLRNRCEWLSRCLTHEPADDFAETYLRSFQSALQKIRSLEEHASVGIWIGDNAHDQTGLRLIAHMLRESKNILCAVNATKAYRERYRRFEPLHMGEILHQKLIPLLQDERLFQPLPDMERARLEQEWELLADSQGVLRIWQDGAIRTVSADYFDSRLVDAAQKLHSMQPEKEWMKAARLIGEVLGEMDQYAGDQYLEYRLRHLIREGVFEMEGSLEAMRCYSVKLKSFPC